MSIKVKDQILKFIDTTYKLKTIVRYNNTPHILNESVAEHSYFVTLIVYKLYEYFSFDLTVALKIALFHDVPEVYLSDIPSNTKNMFPDLKNVIKSSNKQASDLIDPTMSPFINFYEEQKTVEAKIVKLADLLSVLQYTSVEAKFGNKHMEAIYSDTVSKVDNIYKDLKKDPK